MKIPDRLNERLCKLGIDENIYAMRSRKCLLSRDQMNLERVPWCENAYYIPDNFGNKNHFIFDPVSIVPCLALDPSKSEGILDMCAAPGTKTFILSFLTNNEAHITANDISYQRLRRLRFNVEKFKISAEITNKSGRKVEGFFDKILLDAPCSGEGMINKGGKMFAHWSEKRVKTLAKTQKKLITHAFELLAEGGILVYSTCTFEPEENEMVVDFLLNREDSAKMEKISLGINHAEGITDWEGKRFDDSLAKCMRIYPYHNNTGGFFVARIRKDQF